MFFKATKIKPIFSEMDMYTFPVGLATLQQLEGNDYGILMAGATFAAIPMFIIFFSSNINIHSKFSLEK